ncbi:MAG: carboxyl transferase domain-containing protein [Dermatophilaceae bacterium]
MGSTTRLAIIDHGEPVVRYLAAIGTLGRDPRFAYTTIVVHPLAATPWYAREADEALFVPAGTDAEGVVAALRDAGATALVCGDSTAYGPVVDLVAAAEQGGLHVVGAGSAALARLTDPAALAAVGSEAGVTVDPGASNYRDFEVDTLTDVHGTTWSLGVREVTVRSGDHLVLAEYPAALAPEVAEGMEEAARRLVGAAGACGAVTVSFTLADDEMTYAVCCARAGRPGHAGVEETTGASFVELQLRVDDGETLGEERPEGSGVTVEARLLALDPLRDDAPTGGAVRLLSLPVGTGVRVDASLREDDVVDAQSDPLVATVTAWGRDRAEAIARLRRALDRTAVVLADGLTNRTELLTALSDAEFQAGRVASGWMERRRGEGGFDAPTDPMALIAGAVEFYEADQALVEASFRASAARGRPEHPEQVGTNLQLSYRGRTYRLRVDRIAADRYRVHADAPVEVTVDRRSPQELRLVAGARKATVVVLANEESVDLEIDSVAHEVRREDGVVVRTGWPALIGSILVARGDKVEQGQPIAVLESMKMVTTVTAPFAGEVTSVAVLPNAQVEKGMPLLRIRAGESGEVDETPDPESVVLEPLASAAAEQAARHSHTAIRTFGALSDYLLGYDLDPGAVKGLVGTYPKLAAASDPGDVILRDQEDAFLDLFAEIGSLYRPRVEADSGADPDMENTDNTQEFFLAFLQWLDPDRAGLPAGYRARLQTALARYGVTSLSDRDALQSATLWMFRSFSRVPELVPVVVAILDRRLRHTSVEGPTPAWRARLDRLVSATEGRHDAVTDLARDVHFQTFEQPAIERVVDENTREMTALMGALAATPRAPERSDWINRLVWSPQPMRSLLLDAWRGSLAGEDVEPSLGRDYRAAILETYLRRFYRIRDLRGLDVDVVDGVELAFAHYSFENRDIHVVTGYLPLTDLPRASRAIARHLGTHAFQREAVIDLVTWRDGGWQDIDQLAGGLGDILAECDFGRPLHRLDLTVTTLGGHGASRLRTQHLTFRQDDAGGFVEETIYRNLHPMLGKRLDLWRLSNFTLSRLPSPEDVYLFDGVAKDNPKDHRLFALAEVRDLTPVHDDETGTTAYPLLGRMGLAALAAMRSALAAYPARERPVANRLVMSIRPTWTIPATDWYPLARTYEDLARGAGLEKIVLHVSVPETDPVGKRMLRDRILVLDGLGAGGLTIRMDEPGPNPVRPLTKYAQKVLTAARFKSPYPYEIVRMLTPNPGDASPFPPGSFVELDLGDDDELVPVDRAPGNNTAHLVVGLMTSYTHVHPEGLTRIALLSDPTQGLGNLAEPECRRINAVLAYALEHSIPVEWYAVSSGALIAMDSGTENMDWIALTLRRLIEYTQAGGEVNIIVTGINVGGQPYWNAEATMLMHTKGILVMTPASAMVLTGKQALDFSGAVSADDNSGIGGFDRVMGPNGQAQYWAPSFPEACALLLQHYDYTYVVPGERFPRRRPTTDPVDRDVRPSPHASIPGSAFTRVGDVFDAATNPERKQPFDMRSVMRAVADVDSNPLERWRAWQDADTSIVWDATIGGIPVCLLGLESHTVPRRGFVPSYGPPAWTSGTLFPQSSRKTARAVNAASGNRPLVVLANLSGFDGSPESMRNWQLEYGAEIGRAVTNFKGPIVFVVVSRYHGGAFVVFSKALTETMEIAAVEGSFASVIGGAPAAATVFAREVKVRTEGDERVKTARAAAASATGTEAASARATLARTSAEVRSEKLREVADEFDGIHTIERAQRVGSVDTIIKAADIRPYIIDALERGMAAYLAR